MNKNSHLIDWAAIPSPIIARGDARIAYRDPAGFYHQGLFRVFHTLVEREDDVEETAGVLRQAFDEQDHGQQGERRS